MAKKSSVLIFFVCIVAALIVSLSAVKEAEEERRAGCPAPWPYLVKKGERKTTVKTENGEVSTVRISDGIANGWYHIEFITLEPNSVFLPVLLQSDMVFYVHTGSGWISWTDDDKTKKVELRRGDIYRLRPGTLFYIESSLEMERQKLRINALFANAETDLHEPAATGPYTSIRNLILGFDRTVLEAAFGISGEPIEELVSSPDPGAIVHGFSNEKKTTVVVFEFMKAIFGSNSIFQSQSNKKKTKTYNVFSHDPDFENCNGWSTVVSKKHLSALKDLDVSVFMVNLTKVRFDDGATLEPEGYGVRNLLGRARSAEGGLFQRCKNMIFYVEEGDVFAVPRFHPMAQMAFNNHSFVFMGFSTSAKKNHPQYLAGKASALRTLPRDVVAVSFGASNKTIDLFLDKQQQAIILDCTSCAEEELRILTEEIEKAKEEARKKKEEEERKREEEEKRAEEEEAKKEEAAREKEAKEREEQEKEEAEKEKQEEERKKKEEEKRKEEEAAKRAEEEEARKEEAARQREEKAKEEAARRAEEEAARRAGEEAARRAKEEAEREKQEEAEEEVRKREAKERAEEQAREREKQEEAAARRAEEEARQREAKEREEQQSREAAQEEETRWAEEEEARKEGEAMQREAKKREEAARQQEHHEGGGGWGDHLGKEWGRRILKT
nr:vicilin-like seed storage protein At2g18540 [Ipomoea batatas]